MAKSTSSRGAFRVNRSLKPGSEEARTMTATSGLKCLESYVKPGPVGYLARMLMASSRWNSTARLLIWKRKDTPSSRSVYRLSVSKPSTKDTEPGLLPTPRVSDTEGAAIKNCQYKDGSYFRENAQGVRWGVKLRDVVENHIWPTPTLNETEHPNMTITPDGRRAPTSGKTSHSINLADSVKIWPSPRASEYKGVGPLGSKSHDYRVQKGYLDATVQDEEQRTGALNPDWTEWLMGYPIGWTDIADGQRTRLE